MTTKTAAEKSTISVFGAKPKDAILVPNFPIAVRNNCQAGQWTIGDTDYGSKCSMTILKFSKFWGDLGQTQGATWGQIWFVAESGELPKGVVMVTYLKTQSLGDFNRLVTEVQARGVEPATGIFVPEFVKQSSSKPDANNVIKPVNYYSLKWSWQERTDWAMLDQASAVLADPANLSRMTDMEGTRMMQCIDGLAQDELSYLVGNKTPTLPSALPPVEVKVLAGSNFDF
jgi:hypothetical protein